MTEQAKVIIIKFNEQVKLIDTLKIKYCQDVSKCLAFENI
jgi:hypothetical protein